MVCLSERAGGFNVHLSPIERYEFGMLKTFIPNLTDFSAEWKAESAFTPTVGS
jgi:hypothetical protein